MSKTKTKPKPQTLSERVDRLDEYLSDLWSEVENGELSPLQIGDRLDKALQMLNDLQDSL